MNRLTMPLPLFHQYLHRLIRQPEQPLLIPVGLGRRVGSVELFAVPAPHETGRRLYLALTRTMVLPVALPEDAVGMLLLGDGTRRGQALGFLCPAPDRREPLHRLRLVGAGMHEIAMWQEREGIGASGLTEREDTGTVEERERWSRTIGALGREAWERFCGLHCAIVGVGRTGSGLALALGRLGVRTLTLLDPDRIEMGNLGEMQGVTVANVGELKVAAVAAALRSLDLPRLEVAALPLSITRRAALDAVRACDLLICCADHDGARLAASALATLFHRPLVDIATGVQDSTAEGRMGADVRLMLPGRCLLCFGGLRDEPRARHVLSGADAERAFYRQREWRRERAGSLASLNLLATSLALRLCEDLMAERVQESLWAHVEYEAGRLQVSYPPPTLRTDACPLCRLSGCGDAGLPRLAALFRATERENARQARHTALESG